jgi:hypothetical protein
MVTVVQQVPSISEYQSFATGQQRVHMMAAETPSTMLTERMMNQMNHLTHPFEMRSRVMPNDVLLQAAARMVAKPAEYEIRATMGILV